MRPPPADLHRNVETKYLQMETTFLRLIPVGVNLSTGLHQR